MTIINWIIPILSAVYAVLCLIPKLKKYFREITAIYIALMFALFFLSINEYNNSFLDKYNLHKREIISKLINKDDRDYSIISKRISAIEKDISSINKGRIYLTYNELREHAELRMLELSSSGLEYLATHIIDNDDDANIFIDEYTRNYSNVSSFLKIQNKNLNEGGSLKRIFVFEEKWLLNNVERAKHMLDNHNRIYDNTSNIETPVILLKQAKEILNDLNLLEFNILNRKECFIWLEDEDGFPYRYKGGIYIFNNEQIEDLYKKWESLYKNSSHNIDSLLSRIKSK